MDGLAGRLLVSRPNTAVQVLIVVIRMVLLWIVVPVACIAWVVVFWKTRATLGACLGWFDVNLFVFIQRIVLRPLIRRPPPPWLALSKMAIVEHRIGFPEVW